MRIGESLLPQEPPGISQREMRLKDERARCSLTGVKSLSPVILNKQRSINFLFGGTINFADRFSFNGGEKYLSQRWKRLFHFSGVVKIAYNIFSRTIFIVDFYPLIVDFYAFICRKFRGVKLHEMYKCTVAVKSFCPKGDFILLFNWRVLFS